MNTAFLRFAVPAMVLLALPALAATLYVDVNSTNPVPPYTNWTTAANVIQDAVDAAGSGDTVMVRNGVYALSAEITITNSVVLESVSGPEATIIDGGGKVRCLNLGESACTVGGFTIANGFPVTGYAGGVFCVGSAPVVTNCVLTGNRASDEGGGMYNGTAINCIFIGNASHEGGGMMFGTAYNCIFIGNSANHRGGGMYEGVANNSVFCGNSATDDGGGVFGGLASNCTLTGNSASGNGGGMANATANNCIVFQNTASGLGDNRHEGYFSHTSSPDLTHGVDGNITNAPLLISVAHIATNSPCRAAGDFTSTTGTDIDGQPWLNPPSMGCDENAGATGNVPMRLLGPPHLVVGATADYTPLFMGPVTQTRVDFGEGQVVTNPIVPIQKSWASSGIHPVVLSAYNDDHSEGIVHTQWVEVLSVPAATVHVSANTGSDTNDGFSWATAKQTIQAGVDAQSIYGGRVLVTNGTYRPNSEILVNKALRLESANGPQVTIIDGAGAGRCLNLGASASVVSGFTVTNSFKATEGGIYGKGGGIYCITRMPLVTNCVLTGNRAEFGGGMYLGTLHGCTVSNNSAERRGGGLHGSKANGCELSGNSAGEYGGGISDGTADDCTFVGNSAIHGGGGGLYKSTANNCVLTQNSTPYSGGGMLLSTASYCTITGNSAGYGGGVGGGRANNCVITQNSATYWGGGMDNGLANNCVLAGNSAGRQGGGTHEAVANHCTITGNSAGERGGGIYLGEANNSIIYYNCPTASGPDVDQVTFRYSCSPELSHGANGNITNAPLLISSSHIATNSPCRAAANIVYTTGADIDGQPWRNPPSMGCDENAGSGSVTGTVTLGLLGPTRIVTDKPADYTAVVVGPVTWTQMEFGDGQIVTNPVVAVNKSWAVPGTYEIVLTALNDDPTSGVAFTQAVEVLSLPAATVYVSEADGSDANDGSSWNEAKQTVQAGVDAQSAYGGVVLVNNGTYSLTSEVKVNKVLQLMSVNGPEATIIDGGAAVRCMNLDDSACMVTGFTITNGFTTSAGGGVYCINSTPAVTNCVLTGNKAGSGGGMMGGTVKNCLVVGNMALENGGGLASCLVSHCVVTNNAASSGGGMHGGTAWYSSFTSNSASGSGGGLSAGMARGCTFVGNRSTAEIWSNDGGGGLSGGTAIDCTFAGNVAGQGGAVLEGTVVNSVLTGNTASYAGGMYGGTAINCIIASNSATAEFGGMFLGTANNCIIYHNSAATSMNDSAGGIRRFSCSPDLPQGADGNITNAPLFMDTNGWVDLRLQSNSPCINAGNNAYVTMTNDLDGNPRIVGGTADMGAYEFQSPQSVISYAWLQHYGLPTDGSADHAHSDADPHNNWQEWKAWTDPTNELSVLKMLTPQPGTNGTSVSWQSVSGRTYTLERATNSNANWTVLESGISSQANTISFLDTTATNGETFFYRVGVPSE